MRIQSLVLAVATSSVLATGTSFAVAPGSGSGFFVGVDGGYSQAHISKDKLGLSDNATLDTKGLGFGLYFGGMFDRYIGLAFSVNRYAPIKATQGRNNDKAQVYGAAISLLGDVPLYMSLSLYGEAGIGVNGVWNKYEYAKDNYKSHSDGAYKVTPVLGAGLAYSLSGVTFSVGYRWSQVKTKLYENPKTTSLSYINAGISYTF